MLNLRNIFLPEKIKGSRVYAQRILGIAIQENQLSLTIVNAQPKTSIVEKVIHSEIPPNATNDEISAILKKIIHSVAPFDQVKIAIPSSLIIFKELDVPFASTEKIRLILDYEIESMLPFSLDEAIVDFIVTQHGEKENSAQILVAAIRNQDLENVLSIYKKAGLDPAVATIDLLALYNIYQHIPDYVNIKQGSSIIDIGQTTTRISFIINGQLRLTRNIPRGISTIIEQISSETHLDAAAVLTRCKATGMQPTQDATYDKALNQHIVNFFNDIQFSLNSFSLKLNYYKGITRIFLSGFAYQINGLDTFCSELLQIPTEFLAIEKIFNNKHVVKKLDSHPREWILFAVSFGTALPSDRLDDFNLRRKAFEADQTPLIKKQLFAAAGTFLLIILFVAITGFMQIKDLQNNLLMLETREENKLLAILPLKDRPKVKTLPTLVKKAEQQLKDKEELWSAFNKESLNTLQMLLDLSNIMDKRRYSFSIDTVSISEKDPGHPLIEIEGYFVSPRGTGFHMTDFYELEKRFSSSTLLTPAEPINPIPAADKGVRFEIKLKKKDNV